MAEALLRRQEAHPLEGFLDLALLRQIERRLVVGSLRVDAELRELALEKLCLFEVLRFARILRGGLVVRLDAFLTPCEPPGDRSANGQEQRQYGQAPQHLP